MNRDRLLKNLDQANRLIVRGEENIARQQQIITDLMERGHVCSTRAFDIGTPSGSPKLMLTATGARLLDSEDDAL